MGAVTGIDMGLLVFSGYVGTNIRVGCRRNCEKEVRLHVWNNVR